MQEVGTSFPLYRWEAEAQKRSSQSWNRQFLIFTHSLCLTFLQKTKLGLKIVLPSLNLNVNKNNWYWQTALLPPQACPQPELMTVPGRGLGVCNIFTLQMKQQSLRGIMMAEVTQLGCPSQGQPSVLPSSLLSCCLSSNAKSDKTSYPCSSSCEDLVCYIHNALRAPWRRVLEDQQPQHWPQDTKSHVSCHIT